MAAPTKAATCENPLTAWSRPHMAHRVSGRLSASGVLRSPRQENLLDLHLAPSIKHGSLPKPLSPLAASSKSGRPNGARIQVSAQSHLRRSFPCAWQALQPISSAPSACGLCISPQPSPWRCLRAGPTLPQIAPNSLPALIPIGGHSPASIKIPDDRITQELHDQKQCNSRSNRYGKVEKFVNMHSFTPNLYRCSLPCLQRLYAGAPI